MCIAGQMAIAVITQSTTYRKMFQGTNFFSNSGPSEILGSDGKQNYA